MNNLINIENKDGVLLVSSREVAERFEKQHKDVLESIRNLAAENSATKNMFIESNYLNRGKEYPEYLLTRDGFSLLAMGFTGAKALEWKLKYLEAFNRMEETIKTGSIPQGKELLALAVLEAQKTIEDQDRQIKELIPKGIFADSVAGSSTSILVGEMAKILKQNGVDTGEKRFYVWLRDSGYLIKRKGTDYNAPTQRSMELGILSFKETVIAHSSGRIEIRKTPKVTGKGQIYFINKLKPKLELVAE